MTTLLPAPIPNVQWTKDNALAGLPPLAQAVFERIGIFPYAQQKPPLLAVLGGKHRIVVLAGGIQSGKSTDGAAAVLGDWPRLLAQAKMTGQTVYVWLIGQAYSDVRKEFEYLEQWFRALNQLAAKPIWPNNHPGQLKLKGGIEINTFSGNKPEKIASDAPAAIVVCEAARTSPRVLEVVMERTGPGEAWAMFTGTFERDVQTWFHHLYWQLIEGGDPEGIAFSMPSWTNLSRFPGGEQDPEIQRQKRLHNEDYFNERFAGVPVKPRGIVIPEFTPRYHVKECEYDPDLPLWLTNDPGYGADHENSNALLAAQYDPYTPQIRVFDEIYRLGRITERIIDEAMARKWWMHRPRPILVVDPYYKDTHASMPSVSEQWWHQAGLRATGVKINPHQGIDLMRTYFKVDPALPPRVIISPRCKGFLSELGFGASPTLHKMAPWAYNIGPDGHATSTLPANHYNHACMAFIYLAARCFGNPNRSMETAQRKQVFQYLGRGRGYG